MGRRKMAIVRCEKGHYYDASKFAQCPHCGVLPVMEEEKENKMKHFFLFNKKGKKSDMRSFSEKDEDDRTVALPRNMQLAEDEDDRTVALPRNMQLAEDEDDRTVALPRNMQLAEDEDDRTVALPRNMQLAEDEDDRTVALPRNMQLAEDEDDRTVALSRNMQLSEANNDHSELFCEKVISEMRENKQKVSRSIQDYIAGWLVCVEGAFRGEDFGIYSGFNRLLLSKNGEIQILSEVEEEQDVLCSVVYDNRNNQFFIIQQNGSVLVNNKELNEVQELYSGDVIRIGETELEFVAFCREGRTWDSYE